MDSTNDTSVNSLSYGDLHFGRQRIILDYTEVTPQNVIEVLNKALEIHDKNKSDCEYLIKYVLGNQDILKRSESQTSSINNKVVVNYAWASTREIVGYTLGNPIELTAIDMDDRKDVDTLNKVYNYEESFVVDTDAATYGSICGLGYYITLPSTDITKDNTPEVPIVYDYLDPRYTFVVQSTEVTNPQIMSCHYIETDDGVTYTCYTDKYKMVVKDLESVTSTVNPIGLDPITMLENSLFLTGDWEQAISVMNASNIVASDSLNDIEGTIRSLLVILGAELDEDDDTSLTKIKTNRLLQLFASNGNVGSGVLDAKFISPTLDSTSTQNIRDYLDEVRNIITGIPDREGNGIGGDTGAAVLNRNGWTDIEIVAKLKELFIKKAKKRQLSVAIAILKKLNMVSDGLLASDIDVNIERHRMDGLSDRVNAFAALVGTGELATIDCLELTGITNRASEMVERGKKAKEENAEQNSNPAILINDTNNTVTDTVDTTETVKDTTKVVEENKE